MLVVDDEETVRHLTVAMLRDHDRVLEAANGRGALALIESVPQIAVVVTDMRLLDIDGIALARTLLARPQHPVILFLSAFGQGGELPAPLLLKPFHPSDLLAAVQELLTRSRKEPGRI